MNSHAYLMMAVVIIWVLLMTPAVAYVVNGWKTRRDDLVKYFYPHAIALYFRQFSPGTKHLVPPSSTGTYAEKDAAALRTGLKVRYRKYSGVTTLALPVVGIGLLSGLMLSWSARTAEIWLRNGNVESKDGMLPLAAATAFLGGVMWVMNDEFTRWPSWDFGKVQMSVSFLRLAMAVPLGYSLGQFSPKSEAIPALAFLFGTFPTGTLSTYGRRLVSKQLSLDPEAEGQLTALQSLPAVDSRKAELFFQAQVSNVFELAYADPVLVSVKTNLPFIYVSDCIGQALLARYLGDGVEKVRALGLCGAQEALVLWQRSTDAAAEVRANAEAEIAALAGALGQTGTAGIREVLYQVAGDPHVKFLNELWRLADNAAVTDAAAARPA